MSNTPEISIEAREKYRNEYNSILNIIKRFPFGSISLISQCLHRFFRMQRGWLVLVQFLFYGAAAYCFTYTTIKALESHKDNNKIDFYLVLGYLLSTLTIWVYRNLASSCNRSVHVSEKERRDMIGNILEELEAENDFTIYTNNPERKLSDLCLCMCKDISEFLQISENDIRVSIVQYEKILPLNDYMITRIAHAPPRPKGFLCQPHKALECVIFECIRRKETIVINDTHYKLFRKTYFGKKGIKKNLTNLGFRGRGLVYFPIIPTSGSEPKGAICVTLAKPYLLWPDRKDKLERRLEMYNNFASLFFTETEQYA